MVKFPYSSFKNKHVANLPDKNILKSKQNPLNIFNPPYKYYIL